MLSGCDGNRSFNRPAQDFPEGQPRPQCETHCFNMFREVDPHLTERVGSFGYQPPGVEHREHREPYRRIDQQRLAPGTVALRRNGFPLGLCPRRVSAPRRQYWTAHPHARVLSKGRQPTNHVTRADDKIVARVGSRTFPFLCHWWLKLRDNTSIDRRAD